MASLDKPPGVSSDATAAYLRQSQALAAPPNPLGQRVGRQSSHIPFPIAPRKEERRWKPDRPPGVPDEPSDPSRKPIGPFDGAGGFRSGMVALAKSMVGAQPKPMAFNPAGDDKREGPPKTDCEIGPSRSGEPPMACHVAIGSRQPQAAAFNPAGDDKRGGPPKTDCEIGPSRSGESSMVRHVVPASRQLHAVAALPAGSSDVVLSPWFEIHGGLEVEAERLLREMQEKEKTFPNNVG